MSKQLYVINPRKDREVTDHATKKVNQIIDYVSRGVPYSMIMDECMTFAFFAFPNVTPKLLDIIERHRDRSCDFVTEGALPELQTLLPEFNTNNCVRAEKK